MHREKAKKQTNFPLILVPIIVCIACSGQSTKGCAPSMGTEAMLLWGLLFGSIGLGYFVYGRRQEKLIPKYSGIALMVFPYFVSNVYLLVGTGLGLMALPFFLRE
jgi:hypothetical protein